jgi:hypothetical protein
MTLKSKRHPYHPANVDRFGGPTWDQVVEATRERAKKERPLTRAERDQAERGLLTKSALAASLAASAFQALGAGYRGFRGYRR